MGTAFAATTLIPARNLGMMKREAVYKIQMPNPWVAAGTTWDLSADFTEISGYTFGPSGAVTDFGHGVMNLIGTVGTYGHAAATVALVAHQQESDGGGSATDPLVSIPDADDLSAIDDMICTVWGYL